MSSDTLLTTHFDGNGNIGNQVGQNFGIVQTSHYNVQIDAGRQDFQSIYSYTTQTTVPNYVEREEYESQIAQQLVCDPKDRGSKLLVISGLGGSGKSQVTLAYIQKFRLNYTAILWIEADRPATIERDFLHIFCLVFPKDAPPPNSDIAVSRVKAWLQRGNGLRLVVFDGADDIDGANKSDEGCGPGSMDLSRYLPQFPGVHIILTTRLSTASGLTSVPPVRVGNLEDYEAVKLFRSCSKVTGQGKLVQTIVRELQCFALSVTLAGYYVRQDADLSQDLNVYLAEFRECRASIMEWYPSKFDHPYQETLMSAWKTTFDVIQRQSQSSARLLTSLCFLEPSSIFLNIFCERGGRNVRKLPVFNAWKKIISPKQTISTYELKVALKHLLDYHLLEYNEQSLDYKMHKLVKQWGIDRLDAHTQRLYSTGTFKALISTIKEHDGTWESRRRILPHLDANFKILKNSLPSPGRADRWILDSIFHIADVYKKVGAWQQLLVLREYQYLGYKSLEGDRHPMTLAALGNVANTHSDCGQFGKANKLQKDVLEAQIRVLELDHEDTLVTLYNYGLSLKQLGKYEEALVVLRKVLEKHQRMYGPAHEASMRVMSSLAGLLRDLDLDSSRKESADMLRVVIKYHTIKPEPNSQETVDSMSELAECLDDLGEYSEAVFLKREVLSKQRSLSGDEHQDTIKHKSRLAATLRSYGEEEEAHSLAEQARDEMRLLLGPDHPETLKCAGTLAIALHDQGRFAESATLSETIVTGLRQCYGESHPETCRALSYRANAIIALGDEDEGLKLRQQVFDGMREKFGAHHSSTLKAAGNVAISQASCGNFKEAIRIESDVSFQCRKKYGDKHRHTGVAVLNLGIIYYKMGKLAKALELQEEALNILRESPDSKHPIIAEAQNHVAITLKKLGKNDLAIATFRDQLENRRRISGSTDCRTITAMYNLAVVLFEQLEYQEAGTLQAQAYETSKLILGMEHRQTIMAGIQLSKIRDAQNEKSEALRILEAMSESLLGSDAHFDSETINLMRNIAKGLNSYKQVQKAKLLQERILKLCQVEKGYEDETTLDIMRDLGTILLDLRHYAEAEVVFTQALSPLAHKLGSTHWKTIHTRSNLGIVLMEQNKLLQAEKMHMDILKDCEETLGENHVDVITSMGNLVNVFYLQGRLGEACLFLEQIVKKRKRILGANHPDTLDMIRKLSDLTTSSSF